MDNINERVAFLTEVIEKACCTCGLNLTVHEGKIGFVDQQQRKIVAVWTPQYTDNDIPTKGEQQ